MINNENEKKMLEFAQFVTDKFGSNHEHWKYSRDTGDLKHIRFGRDTTGYNSLKNRLNRFFRDITVEHFNRKGFLYEIRPDNQKTFWYLLKSWPMMVSVNWRVGVVPDSNLPDGSINGIYTNWEEDGEYIALFNPMVGREVLKFLKDDSQNPYARAIIDAMMEAKETSWPSKKDKDDETDSV